MAYETCLLKNVYSDYQVTYETCLEAGHMTKLKIKKGTSVMRGKQLVKVLPPSSLPPSLPPSLPQSPALCVSRAPVWSAR